jgi:hypothetical protein
MTIFQLVMLAVLSVLLAASVAAALWHWLSRREAALWGALCLAAAVAILRPEITVRVARAVGIDRGADLVSYCAIVVMMIGFWMVYIRLRQLHRQITLLVRQIALMQRDADSPADRSTAKPKCDQESPS